MIRASLAVAHKDVHIFGASLDIIVERDFGIRPVENLTDSTIVAVADALVAGLNILAALFYG